VKWEQERDLQLQEADLILLLVSSDFISAREQYEKEVPLALERSHQGKARVIPIILRPVYWKETLFGGLVPLPTGGKAVTDKSWRTRDDAFFDVISGIKYVIDELRTSPAVSSHTLQNRGILPHTRSQAIVQLDQLVQSFRHLRGQIAKISRLQGEPGFTLETCENRYNRLYGDTMVFLATYLPERVSNDEEGFFEVVYRKAQEQLRKRGDLFVVFTRMVIAPLARIEKIAEQIDACVATLEFYKKKYFTPSST